MRVCFLGDAGSIHLQRWVQYFQEAGHQVEVISFRPCPDPEVKVHLLAEGRNGRLDYILSLSKIRNLLDKIQPDILHAHYATSFGLLAVVSGFHPLVVSAWGSDVLVAPEKSLWLRTVVKHVLKNAEALTSDSEYMSGRMRQLLNGQEKILKTVTMGVSKAWFEELPQVKKRPHQILSLRGHQEIYNIDVILKAMQRVAAEVPEAKLIIAGEGSTTKALKSLCHSLHLEERVQFAGQLPHAQVQTYLNESAISVSVPSSDATAVSLLETMACGSFPVVTDLPANREWVDDGVNGLIVPAKDPEALAQALIRSLRDKDLREAAIQVNRDKIRAKAIWESNMAEVEELYKNLLGRK